MTGSARSRAGFVVGAGLFAFALAAFGAGAVGSPVLDGIRAQERVVINKHARRATVDLDYERSVAEAYWRRNPDVAADAFFGVNGALGIFGAREHYDRHGRGEGRQWGP